MEATAELSSKHAQQAHHVAREGTREGDSWAKQQARARVAATIAQAD